MEAHDNDKISHLNFSGFGTHSIHAWISLGSTQGLHTCQSLFRNFFAHCTILLFTALSTISRAPSGSEFWNSNQSRFENYQRQSKFWETKSSCKSRSTVGRQKIRVLCLITKSDNRMQHHWWLDYVTGAYIQPVWNYFEYCLQQFFDFWLAYRALRNITLAYCFTLCMPRSRTNRLSHITNPLSLARSSLGLMPLSFQWGRLCLH